MIIRCGRQGSNTSTTSILSTMEGIGKRKRLAQDKDTPKKTITKVPQNKWGHKGNNGLKGKPSNNKGKKRLVKRVCVSFSSM